MLKTCRCSLKIKLYARERKVKFVFSSLSSSNQQSKAILYTLYNLNYGFFI